MPLFPLPKQLYQGQLGTSSATLYTAPGGTVGQVMQRTIIKEIIVCNTDSSDRTFTLNVVDSGGSASAANEIFAAQSITANTTSIYRLTTVIEGGGTLRGLGSVADKVTLTVSGIELL